MGTVISETPELAALLSHASRRSRLPAILALLGIVAVITSLVTLYVLAENRAQTAERQKETAERQEVVARENARVISDQLERIRSAYAAGDMAGVGVQLGFAITAAEGLDKNPGETIAPTPADLTKSQALEIAKEKPAYVIPVKAGSFNQRVYIQFAGNLTRAQITALNQALDKAGWAAEGESGERIASSAGRNEVRYSGGNKAAAEALASAIDEAGIASRPITVLELDIIRPNVLEAWISG